MRCDRCGSILTVVNGVLTCPKCSNQQTERKRVKLLLLSSTGRTFNIYKVLQSLNVIVEQPFIIGEDVIKLSKQGVEVEIVT